MNSPDVLNLAARLAPEVYRQITAEDPDVETISAAIGFDASEMPKDEQRGLYLGHRLFVLANAAAREFGRASDGQRDQQRRRKGEAA